MPGANAQFAALAAPNRGRCFVSFLYHVEKCAGTTLRNHFERLKFVETFRQGTVIFNRRNVSAPLVPHKHCSSERSWFRENRSCTWEQLVHDLESHPPSAQPQHAEQRREHRHVFVELAAMTSASAAYPDNLARIIRGIERVREVWEPRGCEVVLFGLVREPVSHLLATYNYFVVNEQKRLPAAYGRTFDEWISVPHVHNLQSRLFLGEPVIRLQARPPARQVLPAHPLARAAKMYHTTPEQVHAAQTWLLDALSKFDMLAPVERFDELWFLLAERLGLTELRYRASNNGNFTRIQRELYRDRQQRRRIPLRRRKFAAELAQRPPLVHSVDEPTRERLLRTKVTADKQLYRTISTAWLGYTAALDAGTRDRMERFSKLMGRVRALESEQQKLLTAKLEARMTLRGSMRRGGPKEYGDARLPADSEFGSVPSMPPDTESEAEPGYAE
jgi:hypothetical protein